jgi:hypothetical protein
MRLRPLAGALVALACLAAPATARAETYLTPYLGVAFGGAAPESKPIFGVSAAILGPIWGLEVEFGRSRDFFPSIEDEHRLTTVLGRFVLGGNQRSRWRPFAAVGAGIVRTTIESTNLFPDRKDTEPVVEAGGGIQAFFFANAIGIRADVRYLTTLRRQNPASTPISSGFDVWRGAIGACFLF